MIEFNAQVRNFVAGIRKQKEDENPLLKLKRHMNAWDTKMAAIIQQTATLRSEWREQKITRVDDFTAFDVSQRVSALTNELARFCQKMGLDLNQMGLRSTWPGDPCDPSVVPEATSAALPTPLSRLTDADEQEAAIQEARVAKKVDERHETLARIQAELDAELEAQRKIRMRLDGYMTQEEFNLIRGCLHPDKQPEDQSERFNKALEIFLRLKDTVNTKAPIEVLRAHGWEKVSPYYRPSRASKKAG
jgi:hypothetical protein